MDNFAGVVKKGVLFWVDFKRVYIKKIIQGLEAKQDNYSYTIIEDPLDLLRIDLSNYHAIVLIVTDVTKFSSQDSERDKINDKIMEYVEDGGRLIGTHDLLYRRVRNNKIQEIFGYKITDFRRVDKVRYRKTADCYNDNYFKELDDEFFLDDGEICWGTRTATDLRVFFESDDGKPLIFERNYGLGKVVFLNTGDSYDAPPPSITRADNNFILILKECLESRFEDSQSGYDGSAIMIPNLKNCDTTMPFVFISYSHFDKEKVFADCCILNKLGINYWIDYVNITSQSPGTKGWSEEAEKALCKENCRLALIYLSDCFINSLACGDEIKIINERNITPLITSIRMSKEEIATKLNSMDSINNKEAINTYCDLLCVKNNGMVNRSQSQINQIIFNHTKNYNHCKDIQYFNTFRKNGLTGLTYEEWCKIID